MVTIERENSPEQQGDVQHDLEYHWQLDPVTASEVAQSISDIGVQHIHDLLDDIEQQPEATLKRDENREEVRKIFSGESEKQLIILGPCSLDTDSNYTELFDYIETLQNEHPDVMFGVRLNGAKPRSSGGNTGLFPSTTPGKRQKQLDVYDDAYSRGLAIFTEVTDKDQFGVLAPYLTGAWMGARDMASTDLRTLFSATRMNVMVKNATDGRLKSLQDAVKAIGSSSKENDGSGVNLGYLASTCQHEDIGPAVFTVGEGNKNVALVARGYELSPEEFDGDQIKIKDVEELNDEEKLEREEMAFEYLGKVCMLAAKLNLVALLDGSHEVPRMFSLDKKNENRFLAVLKKFRKGAREHRIKRVDRLRGYLGEVSVNNGSTDVNLVLTKETKSDLSAEVLEFKRLEGTIQSLGEPA